VTAIGGALERLRATDAVTGSAGHALSAELELRGIRFVAAGTSLETRWLDAVRELAVCIRPLAYSGDVVLTEGGPYAGAWLESTATINAEILDRFAPGVTTTTHLALAAGARADGMLPYKIVDDGPAHFQIQMVTPLARCVWNHYALTARDSAPDRGYLRTMYDAMVRHDAWLAAHRDTRGTGGVEAFCTFDTGHDASPRFWNVPDTTFGRDPERFDPESPVLPFVAPDLTANVACQRLFLARIAEELGEDPTPWRAAADASLAALWRECFDEADGTFYDRDVTGAPVKVVSDVLLRVLACQVGDGEFFTAALERYLLNTTKFYAEYPFTSIALDDPRFDRDFGTNSWGGPTNLLSLVRAPHAFELHGHVVELSWVLGRIIEALARADRFPQCLDPWTGTAGYTDTYSPSILFYLDAIERSAGVLPRPGGEVWFTGLAPLDLGHGVGAPAVAASRIVDGVLFEIAQDPVSVVVVRDGAEWLSFPRGWRVVTDRSGTPMAVVGMSAQPVAGTLTIAGERLELEVSGNERIELDGVNVTGRATPGVVAPRS
jgi:hypothetical protein